VRNPELTKTKILDSAGRLFNVKGYKATSLSEITNETGLTKGAIYSHFGNKSGLEKETLIYLTHNMLAQLRLAIRAQSTAPDKLYAILEFYQKYLSQPPVHGGCPLINAAVEADDSNPDLQKVVNHLMDMVHQSIESILENGIRYEQLSSAVDIHQFASLFYSSIQGAIMMSKLTKNNSYVERVIAYLKSEINDISIHIPNGIQ